MAALYQVENPFTKVMAGVRGASQSLASMDKEKEQKTTVESGAGQDLMSAAQIGMAGYDMYKSSGLGANKVPTQAGGIDPLSPSAQLGANTVPTQAGSGTGQLTTGLAGDVVSPGAATIDSIGGSGVLNTGVAQAPVVQGAIPITEVMSPAIGVTGSPLAASPTAASTIGGIGGPGALGGAGALGATSALGTGAASGTMAAGSLGAAAVPAYAGGAAAGGMAGGVGATTTAAAPAMTNPYTAVAALAAIAIMAAFSAE
jgi:hypothetical protein